MNIYEKIGLTFLWILAFLSIIFVVVTCIDMMVSGTLPVVIVATILLMFPGMLFISLGLPR